MKLIEIPVNTLVELQFDYIGARYKLNLGLLYKNAFAVYISAIKNAKKTVPATKLKNVNLLYKTDAGVYSYTNVTIRSISYNGQSLYSVQSDQDVERINQRNAYRLFIGASITAKIVLESGTTYMQCILKDISATGMGIISTKKIDTQAKIEVAFRVNENSRETLVGNIIRAYEFKNGKGFLYGCEFNETNETICKYVAQQQEEINRRNEGK